MPWSSRGLAAGWSRGRHGLALTAGGRDGLTLTPGGRDDGVEHAEVVQSLGEPGAAGQPVQPGYLIQEGPRLEGEEVVLPVADAGKVHREAPGDIRVGRPDEHLAVPVHRPGRRLVGDRELGG